MQPHQLALHTYTTKPWSIHECLENYARAGLGGISIWRETLAGEDLTKVAAHLKDSGLKPISLVRGGFFTGKTPVDRAAALEKNLVALRECEALGLPMMVMVCGATPGQSPRTNYEQIRDGLGALAEEARNAGVALAVEPLHPMYAADRSAINTLKTANDLCEELDQPNIGVAFDVFHLWWDQDLAAETKRCAANGHLLAYHICDWKQQMDDPLLDRGIPGEGVIPLVEIDELVRGTGFSGLAEVEIFSRKWWSENQHHSLRSILAACRKVYGG